VTHQQHGPSIYFDVAALAAERRFLEAEGEARVKMALDLK
jgi:hypothetical protein